MFDNNKIYKICSKKDWEEALSVGVFKGTERDLKDNFIHFSTKYQLKDTLKLHYKGKKNLYLLEILNENLNITWERSRNNDFFPHLYNSFKISHVTNVYKLILDKKSNHLLPSLN